MTNLEKNARRNPTAFFRTAAAILVFAALLAQAQVSRAQTTLTGGLVTHWKLDDGSGSSAADSSGSGNTGTLQGGPTWSTGVVGQGSLTFDGVDDRVTAGAPAVAANNFTISFWANPRQTHEIDPEATQGTHGASGQRYAWWPRFEPGADAGAGVSVGTNGVSVYEHSVNYVPATLVHPQAISGWTLVTVVYENRQPKLYINGTLVRTGLTSLRENVRATAQDLGGNAYGFFSGQLDDVRLYNRALSASEVSQLVGPPPSGGGFWQQSPTGAGIFYSLGNVGIGPGMTSPQRALDVNGAINATGAITGGTISATYQDVAEWVPSSQRLAAGTVVVLDPARANHVLASTNSYDTRVAGVVSAQPGIILGEGGVGKLLVATTGRVRVRVDAARGAVKVGDLLVTSDVVGVAMRSVPVTVGGAKLHRPGTIVGKALEPLDKGVGEILVLLSLQ